VPTRNFNLEVKPLKADLCRLLHGSMKCL
jgi:hypothetical protein